MHSVQILKDVIALPAIHVGIAKTCVDVPVAGGKLIKWLFSHRQVTFIAIEVFKDKLRIIVGIRGAIHSQLTAIAAAGLKVCAATRSIAVKVKDATVICRAPEA